MNRTTDRPTLERLWERQTGFVPPATWTDEKLQADVEARMLEGLREVASKLYPPGAKRTLSPFASVVDYALGEVDRLEFLAAVRTLVLQVIVEGEYCGQLLSVPALDDGSE